MIAREITEQLERIASVENFAARTIELTDSWAAAEVGVESVEPILRFMEAHPYIDFGAPGALTHFVERFYGQGYEERLLESVKRMPTLSTVGMLNAVINGTKNFDT